MKQAGASTREMARERQARRRQIGLIGIVLVLVVVAAFQTLGRKVPLPVLIGGCLLVAILSRHLQSRLSAMNYLFKREGHANQGAEGEEIVGAILDQLPPDQYTVLHDVKCPYGNIDHVALTRNGNLFAIETKSHRGKVDIGKGGALLLNGKLPAKDFVAQAVKNGLWFRGILEEITTQKVAVYPIIVFTHARTPLLMSGGARIAHSDLLAELVLSLNAVANANDLVAYRELIEQRFQD